MPQIEKADRNEAIVILKDKHNWSFNKIARVFNISRQMARAVYTNKKVEQQAELSTADRVAS